MPPLTSCLVVSFSLTLDGGEWVPGRMSLPVVVEGRLDSRSVVSGTSRNMHRLRRRGCSFKCPGRARRRAQDAGLPTVYLIYGLEVGLEWGEVLGYSI
jgi:hypothetical protein